MKRVLATLLVLSLALVNAGCKRYTMGDGFRGIPDDLKIGSTFKFGYYGDYYTTWQVLDIEDGRALLVTKYVVDLRDYHDQDSKVTWAESSIRRWLNGEFYSTAFSAEERGAIIKSRVANNDNPEHGTSGGEDTEDFVFLLSLDEVNEHMPTRESRLADLNLTEETEKAAARRISNGSYIAGFDSYEEALAWIDEADRSDITPGFWWLRSPGGKPNQAVTVNQYGEIVLSGAPVTGLAPYFGVRPAMWIDMDPKDSSQSRRDQLAPALKVSSNRLHQSESVMP